MFRSIHSHFGRNAGYSSHPDNKEYLLSICMNKEKLCLVQTWKWFSQIYIQIWFLARSVMSDSLWPCGLWPTRLLCPWDSPGKDTGVSCHFLLQGSSWPRDPTFVSHKRILYAEPTEKSLKWDDSILAVGAELCRERRSICSDPGSIG